jgi:hypothetical protein
MAATSGGNTVLHVDIPSAAELHALALERQAGSVSIYLPTTPLSGETDGTRVALKNLAKEAAHQLAETGQDKRDILEIEAQLEDLVEDDDFWRFQANSLAIFVTPTGIKTFRVPNALSPLVEVADRFHIKPLLRAVTFPHDAYVLAVGMGAVRLIEVFADMPPHAVPVPGLPKDMADALGRRSHGERTGAGTSGESQSESALLTRYARSIDDALRPVLSGHERPLIIAAAEPLASVFRSVSSYAHTVTEVIPGSADHTPDHVLAQAARDILDKVYADDVATVRAVFEERKSQGRATVDIAQAARAATFGAVDTLLVDIEETVLGTVADADGAVTFSDKAGYDTYGVVDEIARRAMKSGARILSVRKADLPEGAHLAATLRYAI